MLRALRTLVLRPSVEVLTVGLPFCSYKLLAGRVLLASPRAAPLGLVLHALAGVDLLLNAARLAALASRRPYAPPVCTLEALARLARPRDPGVAELGLSLDVLLSFSLVAYVLGTGALPSLGPDGIRWWAFATVLNVLGAGLGRVARALEALEAPPAAGGDR